MKMGTVTWVAFGTGAAGVIAGTVFMGLNHVNRDNANGLCPGGGNSQCPLSEQSRVNSYDNTANTYGTLSWIGYGVGVAGVGAGLALMLLAPKNPSPAQARGLRPWIGLAAAGAAVTF
jgi:hypothetical protein